MTTNLLRRDPPAFISWDYRSEQKRLEAERTANWQAHREQIEAGRVIPTFKVPNHRTQIRPSGTCQFCRGSMFDLRLPAVDLEHPHVSYRGSIVCMLCGRDVAVLVIGIERPNPPSDPPKRGRPPTPWTATLREKTQAPQRLCADNCNRPARNGRLRCSSCQHKRADDQFHRVLIRVMTPGVPMPSWKIQALLGVQGYSIGRIVQRARLDGAQITRVRHGWFQLESDHA